VLVNVGVLLGLAHTLALELDGVLHDHVLALGLEDVFFDQAMMTHRLARCRTPS
jgi:hypothetical protein